MVNKDYKKAFGILEVLVTCVIIILVMAAIVIVGRAAVSNLQHTQERAQAIFLAQEGIEAVRQIRDSNWVDNSPSTKWNSLQWNGNVLVDIDLNSGVENFKVEIKNSHFGLTSISDSDPESQAESISLGGLNYRRYIQISKYTNTSGTSPIVNDSSNSLPALNDYSASTKYYVIKVTAVVAWGSTTISDTAHKTVSSSEILTDWRPGY